VPVCRPQSPLEQTEGIEENPVITYLEILGAIQESGADYLWIGMNAAGVYGATSSSTDFDFFIRRDREHLDRARQAFRKLGMREFWAKATSANLIAGGVTDTFTDPDGGPSVDLIVEVSGPTFDEMWQSHRIVEFQGQSVRIASLEHIVASKRAANREKDRYAIKRLEEDLGREIKERKAAYRAKKRAR
jgi:hypothetical protein